MITFTEILIEAKKDQEKLLISGNTLWITYGPNSGKTLLLDNKKKYITDSKGDKNFDFDMVSKLVKFSKSNKPMKEHGSSKMYPVPVYKNTEANEYDIWGGKEKPIKEKYIVISQQAVNVVNFFDSKKEALYWVSESN